MFAIIRITLILLVLSTTNYACRNHSAITNENVDNIQLDDFKLIWHWEDEFEEADQKKLKKWIDEVFDASKKVLGPFPFDLHIHFYKRLNSSEPVPWAHTRRSSVQSVHFHVDPSFDLEAFISDWTAQHEISHVALPFLGRSHSWFSEGFASYMQYQVMHQMGLFNEEELLKKYEDKMNANLLYFKDQDSTFVHCCRKLISEEHNYPAMYWGGASYFILLNNELVKSKGKSLNNLIKEYQKDCRLKDKNITQLVVSLDSLSGTNVPSDLYSIYTSQAADKMYEKYISAQ